MPYIGGTRVVATTTVVSDRTRAAIATARRAAPRGTAAPARVVKRSAQLGRSPDADYGPAIFMGRYPTPDYDDDDARALGYFGADELGFSFNPLKIVSNVAKAVTKGVSDTVNEAKRAANNPLIQAAASIVPGGGLITKGIGIAGSIGNSRVAQAASTVNRLTSGARNVNDVGARLMAEREAAANAATAAAEARARAAEEKAAEGARIQAENAAKAAAAAADRAAKQKAAREKKAAEGAAIQARNAEKAAADKKAADDKKAARAAAKQKAAEAAELQRKADAAAAAGDANAAALRAQADAATQQARVVSIGTGAAAEAQQVAGGSSFAPAAEAPALNKTALYVAGAAAVGLGVLAVMHGGGGGRSWH